MLIPQIYLIVHCSVVLILILVVQLHFGRQVGMEEVTKIQGFQFFDVSNFSNPICSYCKVIAEVSNHYVTKGIVINS